MSKPVRCMWMRGGTSKGAYFLADDLPTDQEERDAFLLRIMGSPDPRQIDGIGGADPLTSKVAVIKKNPVATASMSITCFCRCSLIRRLLRMRKTAVISWPESAPSRSREGWSPHRKAKPA